MVVQNNRQLAWYKHAVLSIAVLVLATIWTKQVIEQVVHALDPGFVFICPPHFLWSPATASVVEKFSCEKSKEEKLMN